MYYEVYDDSSDDDEPQVIDVSPSSILYSQDSIADFFNLAEGRTPLWETYRAVLLEGLSVSDDMDPIKVIPHEWRDDVWWALSGNRRLYLYKALEDVGFLTTVPVLEHPVNYRHRRFTTDCYGEDIRVRGCGDDEMEERIEEINQEWRQAMRRRRRRQRQPKVVQHYHNDEDDLSRMMARWRV